MESPPLKLNAARDEDRISALPDELLLQILERVGMHQAIRAGAVSTRWRHLPHQLSLVLLNIHHFRRATLVETMDAFTGALLSIFPPAERNCECQRSRAIKALGLYFYLSAPHGHLSSLGRAVEEVVSRGKTKRLDFRISVLPTEYTAPQLAEFGQQFTSFSRAYQVAFRWLTRLFLKGLAFGDSDVTDLISACDRLKRLTLRSCRLVDEPSALKIDAPSGLLELEFIHFVCTRIELISVPKVSKVHCHWYLENPPVRFGYVPKLCKVGLTRQAKVWRAPFLLSDCLSGSATNLSKLLLNFGHQMIWIQPEHPKELTAMFKNLTDLSRTRLCAKTPEDNAEKTNVVWGPSKDFKHFNLKRLSIQGFEEEDKVTNYIRLVMKRAVGLKRIVLLGELPCKDCNDCERKCQVDKASRRRVKERLTHGSLSSLKIIIC